MTEDEPTTPLDDATFTWLWRSNIETLPRVIREPLMPRRGVYSIPGKHWGDGCARVLVHPNLELDEQATARELRGLDHPQTPAADDRGPTGHPATDHMEES